IWILHHTVEEGSLPGILLLYVGMPVILRNHNLSTELGVTNRSQGFLRQLSMSETAQGLTHATSCIVEFPKSKVQLPKLPPQHFPILCISWSFVTVMSSKSQQRSVHHVSRKQLLIQPAFAITDHSAQGKTLPRVIVDLREG
ncbi:hypothetical protein DFH29DRAFT_805492, partial [Suillus ampliporus]